MPRALVSVQVLQNVMGAIFVCGTGLVGISMIIASSLSFLSLGIKPPEAEWSLTLNKLRAEIAAREVRAQHPEMPPGVFGCWTILAIMVPADTF